MSLPPPALELAEALGDQLVDSRSEWLPTMVTGAPGTGKTLLVGELAERAERARLPWIRISPSSGDLDGPANALAQAAAGMRERGVNGVCDPIFDPKASFSDKLDAFRRGLRALPDAAIFLDMPGSWSRPSRNQADGGTFSLWGHRIARELYAERNGHRVVFAGSRSVAGLDMQTQQLRRDGGHELLATLDWGSFHDAAEELRGSISEQHLRKLTPLELRVAVALQALEVPIRLIQDGCRAGWPELRHRLQTRVQHRAWLAEAFFVLSQVRISVRASLLEQLLERCTGEDEPRSRALLRDVLLMPSSPSSFVFHTRLQEVDPRVEKQRAHELAHGSHVSLAEAWDSIASRGSWSGVIAWWESLHHWAEAGAQERLEDVPDISMWTTLGRRRSLQGDYEAAVLAFERALALQPDDSYSHEYLAYNLDRCDKRIIEAERSFRRAVELDGENPWWNRRLIEALQRRGKLDEAWDTWLDTLNRVEDAADPSEWLQEHLHSGVCQGFLERGQNERAAAVVEAVPKNNRIPELEDLWSRIRHRLEAEQLDAAVFPESVEFEGRWRGPRLGAYSEPESWYPGRIIALDLDEVELELAEPPQGESTPQIFGLSMSRADFFAQAELPSHARLVLDLFVELHVYADGSQRIFLDREGSFTRRTARVAFDLLDEFRA